MALSGVLRAIGPAQQSNPLNPKAYSFLTPLAQGCAYGAESNLETQVYQAGMRNVRTSGTPNPADPTLPAIPLNFVAMYKYSKEK